MTEEEAKAKWCPFGRTTVADGDSEVFQMIAGMTAANRVGFTTASDRKPLAIGQCLGSACMAWRWNHKAGLNEDGSPKYYPGPWQGFCGLAGASSC